MATLRIDAAAQRKTQRKTQRETNRLIDDVWALIPADVPAADAAHVAATAFDILQAPASNELAVIPRAALIAALVFGLLATVAYALLGAAWLAWVGAACYTVAAIVFLVVRH